jgi:hypothetical protein
VWLAAASPARAEVQVAIRDGVVTIVAKDATLRQILTEWSRVGQVKVVNIERLGGAPMTLQLTNMPEQDALDVLLRSVSGYMVAPRAVRAPNLSRYDRVLVMPNSSAPRVAAAPGPQASPFAPPAPPPGVSLETEAAEEQQPRPATPTVTLPPARGPVFSTFPAPQIVNPQSQPLPQQVAAPAPSDAPPPPANFPGGSQPSAPFGGTVRPGMVVPPPPQPGQQQIAPAARPPEGQ